MVLHKNLSAVKSQLVPICELAVVISVPVETPSRGMYTILPHIQIHSLF